MNPVRTLFLRRHHQVFLESAPRGAPVSSVRVEALEAQLLELGFVIGRELAEVLRALPAEAFDTLGT
jgi:hypothetical protein